MVEKGSTFGTKYSMPSSMEENVSTESHSVHHSQHQRLITSCGITASALICVNLFPFGLPAFAKKPEQIYHQATGVTLSSPSLPLIKKGNYWRERGELEKALAFFTQAIKVDSKAADTYYFRAQVWEEFGKMDKALEDFNTAIKLRKPFHEGAMRLRGDLYQSLHRYDEAIRDYSLVMTVIPTDGVYNSRGTCYMRLNKPALAVSDFSQAIKIGGPKAAPFEKRANAFMVLNQYAKALADYDMALKLDPDGDNSKDGHEHLHKSKAKIYKHLGKMDLYKKELRAAAIGRNANIDIAPFASGPIK